MRKFACWLPEAPETGQCRVHQVILSHIEEQQETGEARSRIVRLMGDVPRIELFARSRAPGWDVWGNEAAASDQGWPPREELTGGELIGP